MAARFAGMLCRREVLNSTFGVKALRTSSSFSTSSFSSSSLLLNSSSSSLAGVSRESGLRSCGLSPHILSSSFVQYRIVSEKKGTTDYVHGSLTEAAAEVTSRTPRVVAFKSVLEELLEDDDDDEATPAEGGAKPKKKEPPPPPGPDWRDHYTGGFTSVEELEEDLKRYPHQLDRETYVPPSEDKSKNWEPVYKERGLWTQEVAESHAVRNPLLHCGEDDLVIFPCERRMEKGRKHCEDLRKNQRVPGCVFFKNQKRALIQMHPRYLLSAFDTLDYYSRTYWLDFGEGKRLRVKPCKPVPFSTRTKKPHSVNFIALDQPPPGGEQQFYEKYPHTKQQIQAQWKKAGLVPGDKPAKRRHPKLLTKSQRNPPVQKRVEIHLLHFADGKDTTAEWATTSNMFIKQEEVLKKYPAFEGKRCGDF